MSSSESKGVTNTDKETDGSWDIFVILKINSGLWALLDCEKKMFGPIMRKWVCN